jgi:hypothetical protein
MAHPATKQSVAFRFSPITVARLKQRAHETNAAQTALAERYIEEGLRRDEHPLVYFRDGEAGRRPALLGTRLDVADVIATIRQNGDSVEEAADYLESRSSTSTPVCATTSTTGTRSTPGSSVPARSPSASASAGSAAGRRLREVAARRDDLPAHRPRAARERT